MTDINDPLWPHFKPLWLNFERADYCVLVAGGYGLFLKQQWLLSNDAHPIVVPLDRWPETAPRATKDMDLVIGLDLISDETANRQLYQALEREKFEVSREPHGKRWQFFKQIADDQHVIVELHAPLPDSEIESLKANRFAVKHKPSLGDQGIHARTNQEAIGSELHPYSFEIEGVEIFVPNPVTWSVMKLTAAEDTWKKSQEADRGPDDRRHFRDQSLKHGNDVCRTVAMMTLGERNSSREVVDAIRDSQPFQRASDIYRHFFAGADDWVNEVLVNKWLAEDLATILGILRSWYES